MKKMGYLVITVSFLAGALIAVLDQQTVQWNYFVVAVLGGIAGVIMVRASEKRQTRTEGKLATNIRNIEESLRRIIDNMQKLNQERNTINPYEIRHRIDALFPNDINTFVEARESLTYVYSMQAYADVMSDFAAGERYLNRVWSASADGYINEAHTYLEKSQNQFVEAYQKLQKLQQQSN